MSVRVWSDDTSLIRVPVVAESTITTAFTVVALINFNGKNNWESMMAGRGSGDTAIWSFGTTDANVPYFYKNAGNKLFVPVSGTVIPADVWYLIAYTIADADLDPGIFRIAELGETPIHSVASSGGPSLDALDPAEYIQIGATDSVDELDALYAVSSIRNSFLSETDFNNLANAAASSALISGGFGGVWDYNQSAPTDDIPDLAGNHDTITGVLSGADINGIADTTIVTGSDPDWTFGLSAPSTMSIRRDGAWVPGVRKKRVDGVWV